RDDLVTGVQTCALPISNRLPLLPTMLADLGHAVWQLDFSNDQPVLLLNRSIENIHMIARGDDQFLSLVYPAVVQRVLLQILERRSEERRVGKCRRAGRS